MIRPLSYTVGSLLAMSLMTNPVYAENAGLLKQQSQVIVLAHNDDKEKREDEKHEGKESKGKKNKDQGKHKGQHKGEKGSSPETEKPVENKSSGVQTPPPPAAPSHVSGSVVAPTGQVNVSGAQTPPPSGGAAHVSGK